MVSSFLDLFSWLSAWGVKFLGGFVLFCLFLFPGSEQVCADAICFVFKFTLPAAFSSLIRATWNVTVIKLNSEVGVFSLLPPPIADSLTNPAGRAVFSLAQSGVPFCLTCFKVISYHSSLENHLFKFLVIWWFFLSFSLQSHTFLVFGLTNALQKYFAPCQKVYPFVFN